MTNPDFLSFLRFLSEIIMRKPLEPLDPVRNQGVDFSCQV